MVILDSLGSVRRYFPNGLLFRGLQFDWKVCWRGQLKSRRGRASVEILREEVDRSFGRHAEEVFFGGFVGLSHAALGEARGDLAEQGFPGVCEDRATHFDAEISVRIVEFIDAERQVIALQFALGDDGLGGVGCLGDGCDLVFARGFELAANGAEDHAIDVGLRAAGVVRDRADGDVELRARDRLRRVVVDGRRADPPPPPPPPDSRSAIARVSCSFTVELSSVLRRPRRQPSALGRARRLRPTAAPWRTTSLGSFRALQSGVTALSEFDAPSVSAAFKRTRKSS